MAKDQTIANDTVSAKVAGYGVSYAITSILSALLVMLKETNESVMGVLVSITGHHWVTQGLLNVVLFVVLGALLSRREKGMSGNALISTVVGATVLSGLIIAGFFIL